MKKFLIYFSAILFFSSACTPKLYPLKGTYPPTPIIYNSSNTFEKVWEKTIDFFAQTGLPIRIIDKSSGLIISEQSKLTWSFEDKKGILKNSKAYVALPSIMNQDAGKPWEPSLVTGKWNIRVKALPEGGCSVNVNLYDIEATYGRAYYSYYSHGIIEPIKLDGRTTGLFEKDLSDLVK
jgi:hypothetical protein